MSNASKPDVSAGLFCTTRTSRRLRDLTRGRCVEAFKVAGLTSGLRCVTDGDDALTYVRREGKYGRYGGEEFLIVLGPAALLPQC